MKERRGATTSPFWFTKWWLWYFRGCNPSGGACWLLGLNRCFRSRTHLLGSRRSRVSCVKNTFACHTAGDELNWTQSRGENGNLGLYFQSKQLPNCRPLTSHNTWRNPLWLLLVLQKFKSIYIVFRRGGWRDEITGTDCPEMGWPSECFRIVGGDGSDAFLYLLPQWFWFVCCSFVWIKWNRLWSEIICHTSR